MNPQSPEHRNAFRAPLISACVSAGLALVKIGAGIVGTSNALIADGIESSADFFSSLAVWNALRVSVKPADEKHPYGHGKAEPVAGLAVALAILAAAVFIAVRSVGEIMNPHHTPAPFTLGVLAGVILIKEGLFRYVVKTGQSVGSSALRADAWHQRSDAITSGAAFIGIAISVFGGKRFATAEDWAALVACAVIAYNGFRLLTPSLDEIMDASADPEVEQQVRQIADGVEGVRMIEKCRIRKSGLGLLMDIHVVVNGESTVRRGHTIAHRVKDALLASELPIHDVVVHIEPDDDDRLAGERSTLP